MNNFLLIIAAILVLVLTALFAVPPMVNWNDFRGAFEEEASRLLDREVRVRGEVSVRILPVPYVSFEKVRIADAPGVPGSFARAEQFKMWLSVPPLLRGVFEARQIELERPTIRLRSEADGSGNWRKLQISKRNLAYFPQDVTLNSVLIKDGTLLLESHHGHEIAKLTSVSGEMTAGALTGPYKFIGAVPLGSKADDVAHEVRLSTARMEDNGELRFSGSVRSPDGATVHNVNGTLFDLLGRARASGRVTSRSRPARSSGTNKTRGAGYELAADLKLDAQALRLENISVTFQNKERQQTLNGSAVTSWREGVVTDTNLSASWLDLDAIAGASPADGPLTAVELLLTRGIQPLGVGVTSLELSIDQANLAGTAISDLKGRMVRRDGVTKIEALRASLPGLSALAIDGFLERREGGIQFDGNVLLQSASFTELAQWGRIPLAKDSARALATSFKLNGNIRVRPNSWEFSDALVQLADATAEGGFAYNWTGRPAVVANIDVDRLALEKFGENLLAPRRIAAYLGLQTTEAEQNRTAKFLPAGTDIALRLRARRITDGSRTFEDVDVDLSRNGDVLNLTKFNLTWQPGLELALAGKLTDIAKQASGKLTGTVAAADDTAGTHLTELLSLAAGTTIDPTLIAGRTPLRVAVDANLGEAGAGKEIASHLIADGSIGNDRLRINARTLGQPGQWHTQPAEIQARISGRDAFTTTRLLLGAPLGVAPATPNPASSEAVPATIVMTAAGTPAKEMKTYLRVAAGGLLDVDFSGNVSVATGKAATVSWSGHLDIRQATAKTLARLTWPALRAHVADVPARGRINIASSASGYRFEPQPLRIGKTHVTGKLELARTSEQPQLTGSVALSEVALPQVTKILLRAQPATGPPQAANPRPGESVWPDTPFDFAHLGDMKTTLDVTVKALALGNRSNSGNPGHQLKDVAFRVSTSAAKVSVKDFTAHSGKAVLKGNADFDKSQAGVSIAASVSGRGISLSQWAPEIARAKRLAGVADVDMTISGRALSPRSLSTALDGKGQIKLSDVRVPGMTTEAVTEVARRIIDGELEVEALATHLGQLAATGTVELGSTNLNVRISDGTLALPAIVFDQDEGGLRNATFIDLSRLQLDSQWAITPAPQPRPDVPGETVALPAISMVYTGAVGDMAAIEPKIGLGDLERELVVRKMEANVARLERLRREDEARAAAEAERQRKIEEEQRRSLEEENLRRQQSEQPAGVPPSGNGATGAAQPILSSPQPAGLPVPQAVPVTPPTSGDQQSASGQLEQAPAIARQPTRRRRTRPRRQLKEPFNPFSGSN